MSEELKLHIARLTRRAIFSLLVLMLTFVCVVVGIMCLLSLSYSALIFFGVSAICIIYLVYCNHIEKKESQEKAHKPVVFTARNDFSFGEIINIFDEITDEKNKLSTSEEVRFYRFTKIFKTRAILYKTTDFNKKDFNNAKEHINKIANKKLHISRWISATEARTMMRFNIIYTCTINDALHQFISQNANRNLTRVEGVINVAIVGNQIIIPPLYGECDLIEISRYKGVIKFINQVLLIKRVIVP